MHRGRPLILVLFAVLSACGSGASPDGQVAGGSYPVRMVDDEYSPRIVRARPGEVLRFENLGRNAHNAVAADGSFATRASIERDEGAEVVVPDAPGVVTFYCTFHGTPDGTGMAGALAIGDVSDAEVARALGRSAAEPVAEASGVTLRVPEEFPGIQAAVDAAAPGDLILVGPGTYRESVRVPTPSLTIRGTDRNTVILDGEFERTNGIAVHEADGVALENMTARNFTLNGFYWTGVRGYRASHLTAINNADYGIYAFAATDGVIEHSYASGSPDAGIYIGQCDPCRSVVYDVTAEHNGLGYSGTNAGGELYLVSSTWRDNRGGVVPNSLDSELDPPQARATIVANLVVGNSNREAVGKPFTHLAQGTGIVIGGGVGNVVARNVVVDHDTVGIAVAPLPDRNVWLATANEVRDNVVVGSGLADLALLGPSGGANCFSGNRFRTSMPPGIQALNGCDAAFAFPLGWDLAGTTTLLARDAANDDVVVTTEAVAAQPVPPPLPSMPADAPVVPALDAFARFDAVDLDDLDAIPLPAAAAEVTTTRTAEVTVSGLDVTAPSGWQLLFGFYAYLLPIALLASWYALAFWDIARRDDLPRTPALGWITAILLLPLAGVIAYHAVGARLPAWLRLAVVAGGLAAYLVVLAVGAVVGGIV